MRYGAAFQVAKPVRVDPPRLPYACSVTPAQLARTIRHVLCSALSDRTEGARDACPGEGASGHLTQRGVHGHVPERVVVASPPRRGGGDYATGVAFQVGKRCGRSPREVAEVLCERLVADVPQVAEARVVGGGFVNVTLTSQARAALVRGLVARRPAAAGDPAGEPGWAPCDDPGPDIARWASVTGESPAALAVRTERSSSLFRVQFAHARACALLRNGRRLGVRPAAECVDPLPAAGARLLALCADRDRVTEPGALARHLDAVAGAFGAFQETCEPLPRGEEKPGAAHRGRLALAEAAGAVLAGGLSQLGVTAPAHL